MIVQLFLDLLSTWLGGILLVLPPLPAEWSDALSAIGDGGDYVMSWIAKLGPIVPFDTFATIIDWWVKAVAFWAAILVVRGVLWLLGR